MTDSLYNFGMQYATNDDPKESKTSKIASQLGHSVRKATNWATAGINNISNDFCTNTVKGASGRTTLKIVISVFSLIIWVISIASLVYCQKLLKNIRTNKDCANASFGVGAGDDTVNPLQKVETLYKISIVTLVLSTIVTMFVLLSVVGNVELRNILGTENRFLSEDVIISVALLAEVVLFSLFADNWKNIPKDCLKSSDVTSMKNVSIIAAVVSGLLLGLQARCLLSSHSEGGDDVGDDE